MTSEELYTLSVVAAIFGSVAVVSWVTLVLQAFLHDKRIALVGLFGGILASYGYLFVKEAGDIVRVAAGIVNIGFVIWFLANNLKKPSVWIPVLTLIASAATVWYFDRGIQGAL